MKKIWFTLPVLACIALLFAGVNVRNESEPVAAEADKKRCVGYTIIEAGKGVDCNGDTIKLIKKYGYYELASRYEERTDLAEALN